MIDELIRVDSLSKHYISGISKRHLVRAVDDVSFSVGRGETLALVGESGCGKTTVGRAVLHLIKPTSGNIRFRGEPLPCSSQEMRKIRRKMQMIFQDVDSSLNPRMRVLDLLLEPYRCHGKVAGRGTEQAEALLDMVRLTPDLLGRYPHELSGGQRQRLAIARAMALEPEFVVADEPAASLDLSIEAQMLMLMKQLQKERAVGFLYISHSLTTVKLIANRVAVMYLGKIVEIGKTAQIFQTPFHVYTQALLDASHLDHGGKRFTRGVSGEIPSPLNLPTGCRFHPRCGKASELCSSCEPELAPVGDGHYVACHLA